MDYDDDFAQQWQAEPENIDQEQVVQRDCDDTWFIPHYIDVNVLRGQLRVIEENTSTHLSFNDRNGIVEIWGASHENLKQAKHRLDTLGQDFLEKTEALQKPRRTKGWAKPDRELTSAEKRKAERAEKMVQESQKYLGAPSEPCQFQHRFQWPRELNPYRLLGGNFENLDPIRTEFKSYIWFDKAHNRIHVAGDQRHDVLNAMSRIQNFCIKRMNMPFETVCHVLQKPSNLVQISLVSSGIVGYVRPHKSVDPENPIKIIRAVQLAKIDPSLVDLDAQGAAKAIEIDCGLAAANNTRNSAAQSAPDSLPGVDNAGMQSLAYISEMTERNVSKMRKALQTSLEQVRLSEMELKMRIRIGNVGLREYPKKNLWEIQELDIGVIPNSKLKSEFNPCVSTQPALFALWLDRIAPSDPNEWKLEPEVRWFLGIIKKISHDELMHEEIDVTFREDGKAALWIAHVEKMAPLDLRVISSERRYSWAWTLTSARRLEADKFSAEGKFVDKLMLEKRRDGDEGTLTFSNTSDIQLRDLRREKKHIIHHRDQWIIELTEVSIWELRSASASYQAVSITESPKQVYYSISMFKDSWANRFAENPYLGLGQVPTWSVDEFLAGPESVEKTLEGVNKFQALLDEVSSQVSL